MVGTTLGHYRIVRPLGHGGMGDVYAAEDLRLHRFVALKVLPRDTALDPERLERFEREAQAVAALNHPNVVTLYGVEEADGLHFLTMELVEGKTLAELMTPEGLATPAFMAIALPLVEAICAAHDRGIIHRDLKPANVMVGTEGRLKVLDFGLAKLKREPTALADSDVATAADLTAPYHVVGTAAYMSPEQAEGRPVDARSDIFSLGVIFYELATGARPFRGDSAMSVLSSVIKDTPPDPVEVNPAVPPELDRIIRRCLAKDPARRYQSIVDLRNDLEEANSRASRVAVAQASPVRDATHGRPRRTRLRQWPLVAAGVMGALVAAISYAAFWRTPAAPPATAAPLRAEFAQLTSQPGIEWFASLSPDGKWVVYSGEGPSSRHIFLQSVGGQRPLDLSGDSTADDDQPVFSPDGERIAFRSSREGGGLFVMGRTGEALRRVTRMGFRPAWSPDGTQLAFTTENVDLNPQNAQGISELWTVTVNTGEARKIDAGDAVLASWSPRNQRIAFTRRLGGPNERGGVWTIPATGGEPTRVTGERERGWNPAWSPDGRFLYFVSDRGGSMNLWRAPIDEASGTAQGEPEPITTPAPYLAHVSPSADGKHLVYTAALVTANIQRVAFDPVSASVTGDPYWVTTGSRRWSAPDPSADGEWVAFYSLTQPEGDLYVARPDGTGLRQITSDTSVDRLPRWSPDGRWIACFADRTGRIEVWRIRPDASDLQQLSRSGGSYFTWSPDGLRIATTSPGGKDAVVVFQTDRPWSEQKPELLPPFDPASTTRFLVNAWSPDGERLAGSVDVVKGGIAVYSFRSRAYERVTDFGEWPVFLPDGRRILFVADGKAFFVVDTRTKQVRKIWSVRRDVIGPPRLTRDGRVAYFSRRVTEADIWMVTLK